MLCFLFFFGNLFVPVVCTCAHWGCILKSCDWDCFVQSCFCLLLPWFLQVIGIWSHGLFQTLRWSLFLVRKTMNASFWQVMACGMSWQTKRCVTLHGGGYFSGTRKMAWHCPQKGEMELILLHKQLQSTYQTVPFRKEAKTTSLWLWWIWKLKEKNLRAKRWLFLQLHLGDMESWIWSNIVFSAHKFFIWASE